MPIVFCSHDKDSLAMRLFFNGVTISFGGDSGTNASTTDMVQIVARKLKEMARTTLMLSFLLEIIYLVDQLRQISFQFPTTFAGRCVTIIAILIYLKNVIKIMLKSSMLEKIKFVARA